jgi:hypothetical protein
MGCMLEHGARTVLRITTTAAKVAKSPRTGTGERTVSMTLTVHQTARLSQPGTTSSAKSKSPLVAVSRLKYSRFYHPV